MAEEGFNALAREHTSDPQAGVDAILEKIVEGETPRNEKGQFVSPNEVEESPSEEEVAEEESAASPGEAVDEEAAPDEDQPSGDEEEQEDEPEESPPIDMPVSWSADDAEVWQALTPQAQAKVLERETARDTEVRRLQNETANSRKSVDAELEAVQTERQSLAEMLTQVSAFANTLDPIIQRGMNTDWAQLARDEGADEAMAQKAEYDQRVQYYNAVGAELQQLQQRTYQQHRDTQMRALREKVPDFAERVEDIKSVAQPYLAEAGFSIDEANQFWEAFPDYRQALLISTLAEKAARLDKIERERATIAQKKASSPPSKVIKPKAAQQPGDASKAREDALRKQVRQGNGPVDLDRLTELAQISVGAKQ